MKTSFFWSSFSCNHIFSSTYEKIPVKIKEKIFTFIVTHFLKFIAFENMAKLLYCCSRPHQSYIDTHSTSRFYWPLGYSFLSTTSKNHCSTLSVFLMSLGKTLYGIFLCRWSYQAVLNFNNNNNDRSPL